MPLNLDDNKRPYFKQLNLDDTFDEISSFVNNLENSIPSVQTASISISESDFATIGTAAKTILPAPGVGKYYVYNAQLEVTVGGLTDMNGKTLALIGINSFTGTKFTGLETYSFAGTVVYQASSSAANTGAKTDAFGLNEAIKLTNYEGGNWTSASGTSATLHIQYEVKTFGA